MVIIYLKERNEGQLLKKEDKVWTLRQRTVEVEAGDSKGTNPNLGVEAFSFYSQQKIREIRGSSKIK